MEIGLNRVTNANKLNFANEGHCSFRHLYICIGLPAVSRKEYKLWQTTRKSAWPSTRRLRSGKQFTIHVTRFHSCYSVLFMEILQFSVEIYSCVKTYFDEFHHLLSS